MWEDFVDERDPNEVSCEQYLALFDDHPHLFGATKKMEFYATKVRIGGFPFYDFVKGYLSLRGEMVVPMVGVREASPELVAQTEAEVGPIFDVRDRLRSAHGLLLHMGPEFEADHDRIGDLLDHIETVIRDRRADT